MPQWFKKIDVAALFEAALRRRDVSFTIEPDTQRYVIDAGGGELLVSLHNLQREVTEDGDAGRVDTFVAAVIAASRGHEALQAERLYWSLEPNDYADAPDFRVALSDRVDRALVHLSTDGLHVSWMTPSMLADLGMFEPEASARALQNLADALLAARFESQQMDGVRLGLLGTTLPFKAALLLAPNLRQVLEPTLGWPLFAVAPDRDFLYLWAAQHREFIERVGPVVVREYQKAPYPLSTEVWEITDAGLRAIGEFSHQHSENS